MDGTQRRSGLMASIALLALIAAGGLLCVIAPALAIGAKPMDAPLFPLLRTSIEGLSWAAPVLLFLLGVGGGVLTRLRSYAIALASIGVLPVVAITEMVMDTSTHNLIPLELMSYLFLAIPALLGALLGRFARARLLRSPVSGRLPQT